MKVRIKRYDESCPPDDAGNVFCPHTGTTYTFWEKRQRIVFSRDDSDPTTASLIFPRDWYVDLFETSLYRKAAEFMILQEGISSLVAHRQMNSGKVSLPLPGQSNILRTEP